jgi:hypothetical protein
VAPAAEVVPVVVPVVAVPPVTDACVLPSVGPPGAAVLTAAPAGNAGGRFAAVATTTSGGGATAAAPAGRNTTPGSPARPLAPLDLPLPTPNAPACPSAAASAGTAACGAGHDQHVDGTYVVLDIRSAAATLAQGTVRPTAGSAGVVVGGADDPGTRPG